MNRHLWMIPLLALPAFVTAQDSGPGPLPGADIRVYDVTLLEFGTVLNAEFAFSSQAGLQSSGVVGSGGVPTGNGLSQSGTTTTSPFSGNTAPLPMGGNGGTGSPSVAAFVVNSPLGTTTSNNPNNANTTTTTTNNNGFANPGTNGNNLGLNATVLGSNAMTTTGSLTANVNGELLVGSWRAFDLGGYSVWFAQAAGNASVSAWGFATPDSLTGWASVDTTSFGQSMFGAFLPNFFAQNFFLFGQAVDASGELAVR